MARKVIPTQEVSAATASKKLQNLKRIRSEASIAVITPWHSISRAWFDDAVSAATDTSTRIADARRREILFSAMCVETYLVEWAVDRLKRCPVKRSEDGVQSTSYAGLHPDATLFDDLERYFQPPKIGQMSRIIDRAKTRVRQARAFIEKTEIAEARRSLDEAAALLAQYNPPNAKDLWVAVPRHLHEDGCLHVSPGTYDKAHDEEFGELMAYRNLVVHGYLSWPEVRASIPEKSRKTMTRGKPLSYSDLAQLPAGWAVQIVVDRLQELHRLAGTSAPTWARAPTLE